MELIVLFQFFELGKFYAFPKKQKLNVSKSVRKFNYKGN